eukprot:TRINITY_DN5594_c0_g1_i1.p1 TRINITY_DN5594_c0_g1~~TRINITY_DN5594_c0_g1_i1.p1  ORF type:complete len:458 (+),score=99.96 TRINITY_DN5594_c0_g1_i1:29-1402(+)
MAEVYAPPEWSGTHPEGTSCFFEVVKSGIVVETVPLNSKAFHVAGRHPTCDIVLDHPSSSRNHAVIQLRPDGSVFVYDLGSTHGTFYNKSTRLDPRVYVPLKVGDMLRFGQSTRFYVLAGDVHSAEEVEAKREKAHKLTQDMIQHEALRKQAMEMMEQRKETKKGLEQTMLHAIRAEDGGWGMNSDDFDPNAEIEVRAITEDMEERFDDEDEYYDRTRTAKQKRAQAEGEKPKVATSHFVKKKEVGTVETEATLTEKLMKATAELELLKEQLRRTEQAQAAGVTADDSLDSYMVKVTSDINTQNADRIKQMIEPLQREIEETQKLLEIVRPALPNLGPSVKASSIAPVVSHPETEPLNFPKEGPAAAAAREHYKNAWESGQSRVTVKMTFAKPAHAVSTESQREAQRKRKLLEEEMRKQRKKAMLEEIQRANAELRARSTAPAETAAEDQDQEEEDD